MVSEKHKVLGLKGHILMLAQGGHLDHQKIYED